MKKEGGLKESPSKINQSHLIRKGGSFCLSLSLSLFPLPLPILFSSPFPSPLSSFLSPSLSLCPFLLLSFFPLAPPPPYPTPFKNSNGRNTVYLRLKVPRFLPNRHPEGSQEVLHTICIAERISILVSEAAPEVCGLMEPW